MKISTILIILVLSTLVYCEKLDMDHHIEVDELDTEGSSVEELEVFYSKLATLHQKALKATTEIPDYYYDLGSGPIHPSETTPRPRSMDKNLK